MNNQKIILDVPYFEKDQAKELGAWWDPEIKKWYVPENKNKEDFRRWLPAAEVDPYAEHIKKY